MFARPPINLKANGTLAGRPLSTVKTIPGFIIEDLPGADLVGHFHNSPPSDFSAAASARRDAPVPAQAVVNASLYPQATNGNHAVSERPGPYCSAICGTRKLIEEDALTLAESTISPSSSS